MHAPSDDSRPLLKAYHLRRWAECGSESSRGALPAGTEAAGRESVEGEELVEEGEGVSGIGASSFA